MSSHLGQIHAHCHVTTILEMTSVGFEMALLILCMTEHLNANTTMNLMYKLCCQTKGKKPQFTYVVFTFFI